MRGRVPDPIRRAQPIGVVRYKDHDAALMALAVRPRPLQRCRVRSGLGGEHIGDGVEDRPQLRVAIARSLDSVGVQAKRYVVDEGPAVDLGQIHASFPAGHEGIQGSDHVVPVDAEVQGEVVASPGRYAGERQIVLGRDRGDERLRPIPARSGQGICPAGHRVLHQADDVVTGLQLDRLDPPRPRLLRQIGTGRLATPGAWVPDHDRVAGPRRLGAAGPAVRTPPSPRPPRRVARQSPTSPSRITPSVRTVTKHAVIRQPATTRNVTRERSAMANALPTRRAGSLRAARRSPAPLAAPGRRSRHAATTANARQIRQAIAANRCRSTLRHYGSWVLRCGEFRRGISGWPRLV